MKALMVTIAGAFLLAGCSLLSMKPLEIIRWEPAEEVVLDTSNLTVLDVRYPPGRYRFPEKR